jgi:hypothetical protein
MNEDIESENPEGDYSLMVNGDDDRPRELLTSGAGAGVPRETHTTCSAFL